MKYKNGVSMFVIAAMALLCPACKSNKIPEEKKDTYVVIHPVQTSTDYQQEYVAQIQSLQNVEIRSRVEGFIEAIHADEGAFVQKGQLLFTLNSKEYRDEILKATATLKNAQAELRQIEVEAVNVRLLTDSNLISPSESKLVQAKKEAAQATIQEAQANISLANTNLGYTQIRAPFSGIINRIPKKLGALVAEGDLLTSISNNEDVFAYFNVSETDYLQFARNKEAQKTVQLKLADDSLFSEKGTIETVEGEIEPQSGTIAFRARFANPDKLLKHGASGKILLGKPLSNVLLIPMKCTYEVQENLYVYVVGKDGKVQQRKVEPVARLTNEYAVKSGIAPDEQILYEGVQMVKDGDVIQTVIKPTNELSNSQKL
jgi:RND family efflux transporter MFP subunit